MGRYELVLLARHRDLDLRAEGDAIDGVAVAVLDVGDLLPGADLEDLDLALDRRLAAGDAHQLAVEREGDGDNLVRETPDLVPLLTRVRVPDRDFLEAPGGEVLAVGRIRHRIDERQVGRLDRLAVDGRQVRRAQRADGGGGAGVVNVNLAAPARGDRGLVGADRER